MKCDDIAFDDLLDADDDIDTHNPDIARHVESCAYCQSRLAGLAADAEQWDEMQRWLSTADVNDSEDADLLDAHERWKHPVAWNEAMAKTLLSQASHPEMLGRIGRYDVERLIGSGGMGVVFKAYDTELNRPVAVKLLAPYLASSGAARKRFAREARAAAAVVDDHVVPIHNVETDDEHPFLVMKYIAGGSLQQRLDRDGPLDVCEVLRIGTRTAKGLAAAHAQGLIHRDVKPSNILLDEGVDRALLTDFGLARATDDASLTRSGFHPGTPHYMSPEQVRGEAIDARSDLFGLGCVLYALCTGHPPFRSETSYAVLRRVTDDAPRSIREINANIPLWLEQVVMKLLAKFPGDRFDSAAQVAELLEDCLAHVQHPTTTLLPESIAALALERGRRPPIGKFIAAAAFAFSLLFAGVLIVLELNKGTLTIESDVGDVPIRITQGDQIVEELTVSQDGTSTRIAAGKYLVELDGDFTDLIVQNSGVTLKRGESEIVRIVRSDSRSILDNVGAGGLGSSTSVDDSSASATIPTGAIAFGGIIWGKNTAVEHRAWRNSALKDAKIHLCKVTIHRAIGVGKEVQLIETFTTDESGRFDGFIPPKYAGLLDRDPSEPYLTLVVEADGYLTYSRAALSEDWNNAMNFALVPGEQLIKGTIIGVDGRPAKNIRVRVVEVLRSKLALLDTWLEKASSVRPDCKISRYAFGCSFYRELDFLSGGGVDTLQNAVTDDDGRFKLRGSGPNDILILEIEGKGIPKSWLWVIGRDIDRVYIPFDSGDSGIYYGSTFTYYHTRDAKSYDPAKATENAPATFGEEKASGDVGPLYGMEPTPTVGDRESVENDIVTPLVGERTLAEAVREFNHLHSKDAQGRPQPPLTSGEVYTCLQWKLGNGDFPEKIRAGMVSMIFSKNRIVPAGWQLTGGLVRHRCEQGTIQTWEVNLETHGLSEPVSIRRMSIVPPAEIRTPSETLDNDEIATPLAAAIAGFNAAHKPTNGIAGIHQTVRSHGLELPPLTLDEVLAAIALWQTKRNEANVDDATFERFQRIARTHQLPSDIRFEFIPTFENAIGEWFYVWSVRILVPQVAKPGSTYAFTIRQHYLDRDLQNVAAIHWGIPAKNGLQAGFRLIPSQQTYEIGQVVDVDFFYRSTTGADVPATLDNSFTYRRAELRGEVKFGKVVDVQQKTIPGGAVKTVIGDKPTVRKGQRIQFCADADADADAEDGVGTKLIVEPGNGYRLVFVVSNPGEDSDDVDLETGRSHYINTPSLKPRKELPLFAGHWYQH